MSVSIKELRKRYSSEYAPLENDLIVAISLDRERAVWDNINGMNGLNGKPIVSENGNTIINSNHHHVHPYSHHHLHSSTHKIHNGYLDQHRPLYVDSSSHVSSR